ncbi:MAG: TetR/AcrR family transcriptional regulator [Blastocatellia bacterium]|nr:TetR/AcrR family transcriptional regulator [Blastocatellia bacterium]
MAAQPRKQKDKEDLRRLILDTAGELFTSEGYENVSMRKIAERIDYSPTTIYLYFRDKEELLREVCENTFSRLADEILRSYDGATSPLERMRRGLLTYIRFGLANPHHYEVVFISSRVKFMGPNAYSFEGSMGQQAFELLAASVRECAISGDIRVDDIAVTAQTLWAGIHGVTSLLIVHGGFPFVDRDVLASSMVDTLIAGLR